MFHKLLLRTVAAQGMQFFQAYLDYQSLQHQKKNKKQVNLETRWNVIKD